MCLDGSLYAKTMKNDEKQCNTCKTTTTATATTATTTTTT
jgi:hypothetical protein